MHSEKWEKIQNGHNYVHEHFPACPQHDSCHVNPTDAETASLQVYDFAGELAYSLVMLVD